jgi:hypothetical protein
MLDDLKDYWEKMYAGEALSPCDEECPEGCGGDHYYELPTKFTEVFNTEETDDDRLDDSAEITRAYH